MTSKVPVVPYAGLVTRTLALAFDALVINVALVVATATFGLVISLFDVVLKANIGTLVAGATLWATASAIYFVGFWMLAGQTPGMRLLGLEVVSVGGGRVSFVQALRRLVGMALSAMLLMTGFLLVLFDRRRQGLHDKIAGTLVLYRDDPATA